MTIIKDERSCQKAGQIIASKLEEVIMSRDAEQEKEESHTESD